MLSFTLIFIVCIINLLQDDAFVPEFFDTM